MKIERNRKIRIWTALACLLIVQVITYYFFAPGQLEDKLLTGPFEGLNDCCDSALVQDFVQTDCAVGMEVYRSLNLKGKEELLKQKLEVDFVQVQNRRVANEARNILIYRTWYRLPDPMSIPQWFTATQTEELILDDKHTYRREARYRWVLFTWIQTFEFFQSRDK